MLDVGFCDFETSFITLFDVYSWPETKIGEVAKQRCNFGVDGVFGAATRLCTGNGWDAPNLAQCVDATTISMKHYFLDTVQVDHVYILQVAPDVMMVS